MTIYIVVNVDKLIESVWTTRALANAAVRYHAFHSGLKLADYTISVREVNTAGVDLSKEK